MTYLHSSQNFVRALKAPNDPPNPESLEKIDIAREVWDNSAINTQNKAEAIVEFILTRLLKEKGKTADGPVTDRRYWELLSSVLSILLQSGPSATSTKTWLLPLLNRIPLVPICASLLERASKMDSGSATTLLDVSAQAICALWPLASPKFTVDILLDCFGALLSTAARLPNDSVGLTQIGAGLNASLLEAFHHSYNKRKVYQMFMQAHLQQWVVCIACSEEESGYALLAEIYRTGQEILFNVETIKHLSDPSALEALFASLAMSEASLKALSKLLLSFIAASRKNRALFGQNASSASTAARAAAMLFYAQCAEYLRSATNELSEVAWISRLALLRVIERESLLGFGQADGQQSIRKEVGLYIDTLPLDGIANEDSALIIEALSVVSRIDHDLLESQLPKLLARLLVIPQRPDSGASPALELLTLCISHHSRARSLPNFLGHVQDIFTSLASHQGSIRGLYQRAASSPLLAQDFTSALAKAVQTFVTPGQVLPIAQDIVTSLERAYETFTALAARTIGDTGVGPRKKARRSHPSTIDSTTLDTTCSDAAAVSFTFLARIAAAVLPILPIHTLTSKVQEDVRTCIQQAEFVKELLGTGAQDEHDRRTDTWAADIVLAAALRLSYALQAAPRLQFTALQSAHQRCIIKVHQRSSILPELFLETTRYLLKTAVVSEDCDERLVVFDSVLVHLEHHLKMPQAWNGRSAEFARGDDGASQAAIGLLRLLLFRFIHVLDAVASQAQLDRLVELLLKAVASACTTGSALTPAKVAKDCLRSAQLWERRRLRTSLLSSITAKLQGIDAISLETIADAAPHSLSTSSIGLDSGMLEHVLGAFYMLLYCPAEYISKSSRTDILRRAVTLDMVVTAVKPDDEGVARTPKVVRILLRRVFDAVGSADHQYTQAYLEHLARSVGAGGADDKTTLTIIEAHARAVFRMAQRDSIDAASRYIANLLPPRATQSSPDVDGRLDTLREGLMSVLVADFPVEGLPGELIAALCTFQEHVVSRIASLTGTDGTSRHERSVALAAACLRFSAWLGLEVNTMPLKASDLVQALASDMDPARKSSQTKAVFGLLIAEFECKTGAREDRLAEMLASYVALSLASVSSDQKALDELLLWAARRLAVEEFVLSLNLVAEILCEEDDPNRLCYAIRLASVLLRGAPEGTLRTTQAFFTRALCTFVNYPYYTANRMLRVQALGFIDEQCCAKPASLRPINLTTMWPLLARILTGATTRDGHTTSTVFHKIVSIVGALVRLRRDLIVNALPHLCVVLRMLVFSLREPRPNLGERQRRTVADSLPAWVDLDHPLGREEGRALARLMTTLITKTVVRVHANPSELQKAESLARPLSKHVAYVIQAYVETVNDALCILSLGVRQELMPGLFVLCGILNEHDRDALMASGLDAAGKATLKALWRDYEKQRYMGKG
ncbi:unnamed protein product [Peniophora sp. CBMAI 1063]|nr:unnamed protein product [Peniophora sp. CBMAI 1063]